MEKLPNKMKTGLAPYISPVELWALSFGCAVGWGAFVMPGTAFLPTAGPVGAVIGMFLGALVMLVIGRNYAAMMKKYPDAGGTFSYAKQVFGHDHGLLSAWFLALSYISILWANATALSLIARNLFGDAFQFGFHYSFAGYDVWLGEILLSDAAIVLFGVLAANWREFAVYVQMIFAFLLLGGIVLVSGVAFATHGDILGAFVPAFASSESPALQVFRIAALAPWAFIGFESIAHSARGIGFDAKKIAPVVSLSVLASFLAYALLALLAVAALPEGFQNWRAYIASLGSLGGIAGLPPFFAAQEAMGESGTAILGTAVISGVITGLIGMYVAASRLLYSMAKSDLLPPWFAALTEGRAPKNAILFIMGISLVVPFFGRTIMGWIVDVTTVGATIAYGYTSAAAYVSAKRDGDRATMITGLLGIVFSALFILFLLAPELWDTGALAAESYIVLATWSMLGFVVFRFVFSRDKFRLFGKSTAAWIGLLFLILLSSTMWIKQATHTMVADVVDHVSELHVREWEQQGARRSRAQREATQNYIRAYKDEVRSIMLTNTTIQLGLISISLAIMFNIFSVMRRREQEADLARASAEEHSKAKTMFLSNMSHDIRTPMNAIIGYIELAKRLNARCDNCELCSSDHCTYGVPKQTREFLGKIDVASHHLLSLINDILEMSRIESGKMELDIKPDDLCQAIDEMRDMFATQMEEKKIRFVVDSSGVRHRFAHFEKNRLNRVLLNLLSNAYKFTPEGGTVSVVLAETEATAEDAVYELRVKDSGIGMSPEFAATVFEAFTRERTSTVSGIQGTGLGMAITKNIIDLMGGSIEVVTAPGQGTEFVIRLRLALAPELAAKAAQEEESAGQADDAAVFAGKKLLLVDDLDVNREIAKMLLMGAGFEVDTAVNGKEAVDKVAASKPGEYSAVLMDIQMPVMNGYEATQAIRALPDERLAHVPILAMTASAFSDAVTKAKTIGMDGHIAKPIDIPQMMRALQDIVKKQ